MHLVGIGVGQPLYNPEVLHSHLGSAHIRGTSLSVGNLKGRQQKVGF